MAQVLEYRGGGRGVRTVEVSSGSITDATSSMRIWRQRPRRDLRRGCWRQGSASRKAPVRGKRTCFKYLIPTSRWSL